MEHPLEEAVKFLIPLQQLAKTRVETHLLAYEIHSRRSGCGFSVVPFLDACFFLLCARENSSNASGIEENVLHRS